MTQKILIISPYFFPGINGGGPVVSVSNILDNIKNKNFDILTRNHDYGSNRYTFEEIQSAKRNSVNVYYTNLVAPLIIKFYSLYFKRRYEIIYTNSFFDPLCILIILSALFLNTRVRVICAPRGELDPGSLSFKSTRKQMYIKLFKLIMKIRKIDFHATNVKEKNQIVHCLGLGVERVKIYSNIPDKETVDIESIKNKYLEKGGFKLIMFGRVSEEKNLLFSLRALSYVKSNVEFDIIGPVSPPSQSYFNKCMNYSKTLPSNIKVNYLGAIGRKEIIKILPFYDLAIYPSFADNFAHAVSDILRCGVKILISPNTPWDDVEILNIGKIIDLDDPKNCAIAIEYESSINATDIFEHKKYIVKTIKCHKFYSNIDMSGLFERN